MDINNKTIIITGASSGIGVEIAKALAAEGANLMLTARRKDKLDALKAQIHGNGSLVAVTPGDITSESDCRRVVNATVTQFGTVDVLVNNAGAGPPAALADTTEDLWDLTIDTCLKGVYLMTRAVMPHMLENEDGGAVVQISSVAGKNGYENRTAYCAAKWGVQGFTEALRAELGGQGIRAFTINPGAVATPWWQTNDDGQPDEVMSRMIQPEEVADAVRWTLLQPDHLQIDEVVIQTRRSPWAGE